MRRRNQRSKSVGRATLLVPLAALAAVGCTSAGPASTGSAAAVHPHAQPGIAVPVTAYLSVVQNYDVPVRGDGPGQWRYTVTDRETITELDELIGGLPTSETQSAIPCSSQEAPAFDLLFRDAKGGKPVAQVDVVCFGVLTTTQGHDEPVRVFTSPSGQLDFLRKVESLLEPYAPRSATATPAG